MAIAMCDLVLPPNWIIAKTFHFKLLGSFHVKSPNALNGSDPDFDENAYIWSLSPK